MDKKGYGYKAAFLKVWTLVRIWTKQQVSPIAARILFWNAMVLCSKVYITTFKIFVIIN